MTDLEEYNKNTINKIHGYIGDEQGWNLIKKSGDATVWGKSSPHWSGMLYKSECIINKDPETVFSYIDPVPGGRRSKWDKAVKKMSIIHTVNENLKILRTITHSAFGGIISSRDFTDLTVKINNDEYIATMSEAIEFAECPASSDYVRGTNHACALICYRMPGEPSSTRVVTYNQTDLAGLLPSKIVATALPSNLLSFYDNVKGAMKADGCFKD